jgi:hypothetical protein
VPGSFVSGEGFLKLLFLRERKKAPGRHCGAIHDRQCRVDIRLIEHASHGAEWDLANLERSVGHDV